MIVRPLAARRQAGMAIVTEAVPAALPAMSPGRHAAFTRRAYVPGS
ncbi:hypothetical protein [Microlunatus spumicola]